MLVGTKSDDADNVKVKVADAAKQAQEWEVPFKPVSAKTGANVMELLKDIADSLA